MDPRLKSSNKWTALPDEYIRQIEEVFAENFAEQAKKGKMIAQGKIFPAELLLRIGYLEKGRLVQANFEVSIEYDKEKDNVVKMVHMAVDCAGSLMMEYFDTKGEADFPYEWKSFTVEGREIFLKFSTVNTELESEADALLGNEKEATLVQAEDQEEADEEEKEAVIQMLGLNEDENKGNKQDS